MKKKTIALGFVALVWLVIGISACRGKPASTTGSDAQIPKATTRVEEAIYPPAPPDAAPQSTKTFDPQTAYPGLEQTFTGEVMTLTAMPTTTPVPPTPTFTITPTRGSLANPLPAPIYMTVPGDPIDQSSSQIWRLGRDGHAIHPITNEAAGVNDFFDVAGNGRLAYVSNNDLIVTDANGGNRQVVVDGVEPPPPAEQDEWYHDKLEINSPSWSPDGRKIAYHQDGVNLIDLNSGTTIKVVEGEKWVTNPDGNLAPPDMFSSRRYLPIDWTPDGSQIVLHALGYEWGETVFVAPVPNAPIINLDIPAAGCCDYSFTSDGQMLLSSGNHTDIGLWLLNPGTGKAKSLTESMPSESESGPVVYAPRQTSDGRIYFFTTKTGKPFELPLHLAFVEGNKIPFRIPEDATFVGEAINFFPVLWLPDASRVIVRDDQGELGLMEIESGNISYLEVKGHSLQWGPTR